MVDVKNNIDLGGIYKREILTPNAYQRSIAPAFRSSDVLREKIPLVIIEAIFFFNFRSKSSIFFLRKWGVLVLVLLSFCCVTMFYLLPVFPPKNFRKSWL